MRFYLSSSKIVQRYFHRTLTNLQRTDVIPNVFDRQTKLKQRERTCLDPEYNIYSYVHERVAQSLVDRIFDIKRSFDSALDLGCGRGLTASELTKDVVKRLTMIDSSSRMLNQIRSPVEENGHGDMEIVRQQMDEEELIGKESSYDLAYSCLALHWVNDLPGVFRKVLSLLKNDAPFIGKLK